MKRFIGSGLKKRRYIGSGLKKRMAKELFYKNIPTIPMKYLKREATQKLANALKRQKAEDRAEFNRSRNQTAADSTTRDNPTAKQRRVEKAALRKLDKYNKVGNRHYEQEDPEAAYYPEFLRLQEISQRLFRKRKATGRTDVRRLGKTREQLQTERKNKAANYNRLIKSPANRYKSERQRRQSESQGGQDIPF